MLLIFNTLWIVDLGGMIIVINITRATILTITTIITTIAISYRKESVMFVAKKVVALINTQTMNNGRQKNFGDETKNFV